MWIWDKRFRQDVIRIGILELCMWGVGCDYVRRQNSVVEARVIGVKESRTPKPLQRDASMSGRASKVMDHFVLTSHKDMPLRL